MCCCVQGESKKQSTPQTTTEKIAHKLTKPLQPPNPSEKGTELHLRIQYRDLTVDQVSRQNTCDLVTDSTTIHL